MPADFCAAGSPARCRRGAFPICISCTTHRSSAVRVCRISSTKRLPRSCPWSPARKSMTTIDHFHLGSASGAVEGVVLVDKAAGMSSNAALQAVRRLFGGVKGGHTGTLDPLATGLLPVCLGPATKFAGVALETDKTYEAVVGLGVATTTGDAEGEPLFRGRVEGCVERVSETLAAFTGEIEQLPPMFSAIKHRGRALYRYARAGQSVERCPRRVTVHALDLIAVHGGEISLRIHCSKG